MFRLTHYALTAAVALLLSTTLYADNVEVFVDRGDVFVIGDNDSNHVQVYRVYSNLHVFRGMNGTRINGSTSIVVFPIQDDLIIELEDGHDTLDIVSLRANNVSHADVHLELGDGNDDLFITNADVARNLIITGDTVLNLGNDDVNIENVSVGGVLFANLSDGVDRFDAFDCLVENTMSVNAVGRATIICQRNIADEIVIDSGQAGADVIRIVDNDTAGIQLQTSDEADDVIFLMNSITEVDGFVNLAGGNDELNFRYNQLGFWGYVPGIYTVSGGSGTDTGIVSDNGWIGLAVFLFEGTVK